MNREPLEFDPKFSDDDATVVRPIPEGMSAADPVASKAVPTLHYQVALPEPTSHLFEVTLQINGWGQAGMPTLLDLKMPVWTPGSYLVREYARHLQGFTVWVSDRPSEPLPWRKLSKNHWQIDPQGNSSITVRYRIYANELTVRTNHLDSTHGYFNGAALFFYVPGYDRNPIQLTITPPYPDWFVSTALPTVPGAVNTFIAKDFDTLVDSPVEVGRHQLYQFEVLDKPHQLAVWGEGNLRSEQVIPDIQKIVQVEAELFNGLPYDRYLFLLHLSSQGFGGLEHKDSCSLIYSRFGFRNRDKYNRFMQLVAHEFFHLWNVKRIRPKALEQFDYEQENYTPSLWFSEGTTSYYDLVIPLRAGIYNVSAYLNNLSQEITRFLTTPGRKVQPLSESSFDAWIKLYRPDANSPNSQMSYYLKGEMVSLLLDLLIRDRHQNQRSLDDVMRQMWQQFGQPETGFTAVQLKQVIETVAGTDLTDFFARYLDSTEELPFDHYLSPFGLRLQPSGHEEGVPYLGMNLKQEQGQAIVKFVESGSPAQIAGLDAGDELLAINGIRVNADQLNDRLLDYQPGSTIQLTAFHQDQLQTYSVMLADPRPTRYQIVAVDRPSTQQEQAFQGWLGVSLAEMRG